MKIKIEGLDMAYSEATAEEGAKLVAERFGIIIELTGRTGGGGWPEVNMIGEVHKVVHALLAEDGWSSGDEACDAEMLYYCLRDAKPVFG